MRARAWRALGILPILIAAACSGLPDGAKRKSQPAEVRQRMGSAELRVVYNRPSARGRTLYGGIVPWDSIWNPGADEATRLEVSRSVRVNGRALPAGEYSIWAIPRPDEWTLIFSRAARVPHVPYPEGRDALRLRVVPAAGPFTETLEFGFPVATADSAVLHLRWGGTTVPLRITHD
ncbi:MAG: DUF2911 domain-containing protein [Gemmatimonadetes bacterium]|nr:DUF2911 domain-containing protein [Gemmatimonadota bacterium]